MTNFNTVVVFINVGIIALLLYLHGDMVSNPVDVYSDGQAGIGIGLTVLVIQFLRLFLLVFLLIYMVIVIIKRGFKQKLTILNFLLFAVGLTIGYLIIK